MGSDRSASRTQVGRHRSPTSSGSTKDAILDSAEALFAEADLASVTMRAIAEDAEVDPASITYHFGGKTELLAAIIRRRYGILREHRMRALTRVLAESAESPTARELLDTVYRPWFELISSGDVGWRSFAKIVAAMPDSPVLPRPSSTPPNTTDTGPSSPPSTIHRRRQLRRYPTPEEILSEA